MVNSVHPYSFGIVDTYGAMYMDDVDRLYGLIDHNMLPDICINFHSHNNYQLSFAFAQEVIKLGENSRRKIIIDGTLSGMGKVAGNLNLELIIDFLVRKKKYDYDLDAVFDLIDDFIHKYALDHKWGYSISSLMAGIYKSHPNNVIYLTDKFRLDSKDIGKILSMIDSEKRQRYDYDNIQRLYTEYNHTKVDDANSIEELKILLKGREVLIVSPGHTILEFKGEIEKYILEHDSFVISVNFVSGFASLENRMSFFGSNKRYKLSTDRKSEKHVTVVSNVHDIEASDIVVNYESLIDRKNEDFDNTMIMLFNLLKRLGIKKFAVAGFDGYSSQKFNYCDSNEFQESRFEKNYETITTNMRKMLEDYALLLNSRNDIKFITPSAYSDIFKGE